MIFVAVTSIYLVIKVKIQKILKIFFWITIGFRWPLSCVSANDIFSCWPIAWQLAATLMNTVKLQPVQKYDGSHQIQQGIFYLKNFPNECRAG